MKASRLKKAFIDGSRRRLELLKFDLLQASSYNNNKVNKSLIEKYLEIIGEKENLFDELQSSSAETSTYDISGLESDVSLLLEDVVLNERDSDNLYSAIKEIFYEHGIFLVFYPTVLMESPDFRMFQDVFFIGVPIGILYDKKYFPLVLHEIGHNIFENTEFCKFDEAIAMEVDRIKEKALRPSNLDRINLRLLNRAKFYERVSKSWLSELNSDIFGAYMAGFYYLEAFVLYQMNKRYFAYIDDHPTNKLRYLYLRNYLIKTESISSGEIEDELLDLVNTDAKNDKKFRLLQGEQYQKFIFEGFEEGIKSKTQLPMMRDRIRQMLESKMERN